MSKVFVEVTARHDINGNIHPISIKWEDSRNFEIDRVFNARQAPSLKSGGFGMRYSCRICNREAYLFDDEGIFFTSKI
jgi:hypothetical protein